MNEGNDTGLIVFEKTLLHSIPTNRYHTVETSSSGLTVLFTKTLPVLFDLTGAISFVVSFHQRYRSASFAILA